MGTNLPKPLHLLAGVPLISHVCTVARSVNPHEIVVVVPPGESAIGEAVFPHRTVVQGKADGSGGALQCLLPLLADTQEVLVLYADTPLMTKGALTSLLSRRRATGAPLTALAFRTSQSEGYGRLCCNAEGRIQAIVEHRELSLRSGISDLCNGGALVATSAFLRRHLPGLQPRPELYLTDLYAQAAVCGTPATFVEVSPTEAHGINTPAQLAEAEAIMQKRLRAQAFTHGVQMLDPRTLWLSADTVFSRGVVIEPSVFIGSGVRIGQNVRIKAFSYLEGVEIAREAVIGPFARIRPHTRIAEEVRIGNFVEVKNASVERAAKAKHLSYLGDCSIGEKSNIGAGVVFCNYDGRNKQRTCVREGALVGANSALVAPVRVGKGATVGAGSVIVRDVPENGLGISRARQVNKRCVE